MKQGTIKQILLLTDGCSNVGEDPSAIAALAKEQGITVNVIGVVENDQIGTQGIAEIEAIANAGGGFSRVVYTKELSKTVQMVTRQAMTQTIYGVVNYELTSIFGEEKEIDDLPPDKRGEVIEVVDDLGETLQLDICVLVDMSASMRHKLSTVKESLVDLSLSMQARVGENSFALLAFPGKRKETEKLVDWTPKINELTTIFNKLSPGGTTPTGPALRQAIAMFSPRRSKRRWLRDDAFNEESSG
ncbi:VWA domain-containing protein [Pueribacillus sp. YX66]|uniref:VWA domain-containing protein n=1 Tax=Pueribacillus sp. YX66 TaxID=3229242 RepID=UPI00358D1E3B